MIDKILAFIKQHNMLVDGDKVLVACSGGPDSLALLDVLLKLQHKLGISIQVAHVNHLLRGDAAERDAQFVKDFCRNFNVPCHIGCFDVQSLAKTHGRGFEEEARIIRYEYFNMLLIKHKLNKIIVGHHLDDQAETVLHNIIRGSGSRGLRGIMPINGNIIRPFLCVTKAEIFKYCKQEQLVPCIDATNESTEYMRNKIRLEILPFLRTYNKNITDALARLAEIMREEYDYIEMQTEKEWREVVCRQEEFALNLTVLLVKHKAMQRELLRKAYIKFTNNTNGLSYKNIDRLLEFCNSGSSGSMIELPGKIIVYKNYDCIIFRYRDKLQKKAKRIAFPGVLLLVPGITVVEQLALEVTAEIVTGNIQKHCDIMFDFDKIKLPLYIRTRKDGDIFYPSGLKGKKKLKDFFIDAKISRNLRDKIPLICDDEGILAVGQLRQSEKAKISANTKNKLCLSFKYWGGNDDGK